MNDQDKKSFWIKRRYCWLPADYLYYTYGYVSAAGDIVEAFDKGEYKQIYLQQ